MEKCKIILACPDDETRREIRIPLTNGSSCEIMEAKTGTQLITLYQASECDMIIMTQDMPDLPAMEVLQKIRLYSEIPIIIIGENRPETAASYLNCGADDYVTYRATGMEIRARMYAVLRRCAMGQGEVIRIKWLEFHVGSQLCKVAGQEERLTKRQHAMLLHMIRHRGEICKPMDLERAAGENPWASNYNLHRVTEEIRGIRDVIELRPSEPEILINFHGQGYMVAN